MEKKSSHKKKTETPRKNKTGQNESFMLHKYRLHIRHPTSTELSRIKSERIFLMRNMRKVKLFVCTNQNVRVTQLLSFEQYNQNKLTENDSKREKSVTISYILKQICEEIADYKGWFYRTFSYSQDAIITLLFLIQTRMENIY